MEHEKPSRPDELLAAYGGDRRRWPRDTATAADRGTPGAEAEAAGVDRILDYASKPAAPEGSIVRLLDRVDESEAANVVAFRRVKAHRPGFLHYAALPLAASLALGIYLGALGALDAVLPSVVTGSVASNDDAPDDLGGVDELIAYGEDYVT